MWVRNLGVAYLGASGSGCLKKGIDQGCHHLLAPLGEDPLASFYLWILAGLSLHSELARDSSYLAYGLLHRTFCKMVASKGENIWESESTPAVPLQPFLKNVSYHFWSTLIIRIEALNSTHTEKEGITQRHIYQDMGITGDRLTSCLLSNY